MSDELFWNFKHSPVRINCVYPCVFVGWCFLDETFFKPPSGFRSLRISQAYCLHSNERDHNFRRIPAMSSVMANVSANSKINRIALMIRAHSTDCTQTLRAGWAGTQYLSLQMKMYFLVASKLFCTVLIFLFCFGVSFLHKIVSEGHSHRCSVCFSA